MAKNKTIWIVLAIIITIGITSIRQEKKEAASPLIITDLTNIDVSNLVEGISFAGCQSDALTIYIGDASKEICCINEWGSFLYPTNMYYEEDYSTTAQAHFFYELYSCPITIPQGRYVNLAYDGTNLNIYLPGINTGEWKRLYPSSTGETYYDSALTNPACTYSNGCIGATYSQFLSYKDSYLLGPDSLSTFISNANKWVSMQ